jgi:hypothetical protein
VRVTLRRTSNAHSWRTFESRDWFHRTDVHLFVGFNSSVSIRGAIICTRSGRRVIFGYILYFLSRFFDEFDYALYLFQDITSEKAKRTCAEGSS